MTFMSTSVAGSHRYRVRPSVVIAAVVFSAQAVMLPALTEGADGEVGKTAEAAPQDGQKNDPLLPVAFRLAATAELDAAESGGPDRSPAATGVGGRPWRDARSQIPRSVLGSGAYDPATFLNDASGHSQFSFSRSVAPLLALPAFAGSASAESRSVAPGPAVGGRIPAKFRSSLRARGE